MFKGITRTTGFWSIFLIASLASAIVGGKYLFKVLPMMSIDLQMSRDQALEKTNHLAKSYNWVPNNPWQVAHFEHDGMTQVFAELECGGIKTFQTMIKDKLYEPYKWHVRNFKENTTQESHVFFTPQGEPYGFEVKLAETDTPGNLDISEARAFARKLAQKDWNISFDNYKEVEASKETTPQARIDHTFLYERTDKTLGQDGKYRIKLVVRGNVFAQLTQFVHVPETFVRRYQEMRSQNNMFSSGFSLLFKLLYLLFGGLIGGFILIKKRRYLLVPAATAVATLSLFAFLSGLNTLPTIWMHYNTAQSSTTTIVTFILGTILSVFMNFITFLLVVGAGESLTRWAFPDHIQFWKSWSKKSGGSLTILGQTIGGYGLFCFELSLMAFLYFVLTQCFGWWSPTVTLIDPNILGTYAPWIGAFSNSLSAGFWEEFAFRALPMAGMILLGRYLKQETLFLTIGLIGQAIIFGGMHTFYAQQPVYFRIVELFLPSIIWAITYLAFGILPGIICHYLWDLMWFSFPIMVSNSPGAFVHKIIVITLALFPLLAVLYRRWQAGVWNYAPESEKNSAWKVPSVKTTTNKPLKTATTTLSDYKAKVLLGAGIVGLSVCLFLGTEKNTNPTLTITKQEAITAAKKALHVLPDTDKQWKVLVQSDSGTTPQQFRNYKHIHSFMWQTQPREQYKELLGSYLTTAHWKVRFAQFEGDLTNRAEEYVCFVNTEGKVYRILHVLPESQHGASLSEGEARGIAIAAIQEHFDLETKQLKEISAIDIKKPERKDWNFIFQDTSHELKEGGQTRIRITIGGKQVTDYDQFIFVPETWVRAETLKESIFGSFKFACILFIVFFILIAMSSLGSESLIYFNFKQFGFFFALLCTLSVIVNANQIALFAFNFTTAQSFSSQLFSLLSSLFGSKLLQAFGIAFLTSSLTIYCKKTTYKKHALLPVVGFSLPLILYGIAAICSQYIPHLNPTVADVTTLTLSYPWINTLLTPLFYLLLIPGIIIPISMYLSYITDNWKTHTMTGATLCLSLGITITSMAGAESIMTCCIIGVPLGVGILILHRFAVMHDPSILILGTASALAVILLKNGLLNGYPFALTYALVSICCVLITAFLWFKKIKNK